MNHNQPPCMRMLDYRPPRIAMALFLGATLVQFALPVEWLKLSSLLIAGCLLIALGFGIMIRAWWLFRKFETAICPTAKTTSFITDDIYSLTRNPMYLGMVLMPLGIAALVGNWLFYAAALIYGLILNHVFCAYEERELRDQYGAEYAVYEEQVRRWL
jgi:protein-S-isoprenylcysteine O-methyltransferase Ste14